MKIAILQCDDVQEKLQPEHGNYPEMFISLFHAIDPNLSFTVYRVMESELPASINACDTWLITGSKYSTYEQLEWIPRLEDFIRTLYQHQKRVVGICFGHQIMAQALGGKVEKSDKGWGVGVSINQITTQKKWMQPPAEEISILVSHQDQVSRLPDNTTVLATSNFCPFYILQYGDHFLSLQGHPEFTKAYSRELMVSRKDRIPSGRIQKSLTSLHNPVHSEMLAAWCVNFLSS